MLGDRFFKKQKQEQTHKSTSNLQLERLKMIVGNPLSRFPKNAEEWWSEASQSPAQLAMKYGLNGRQALALQQTLLLLQEATAGVVVGSKKAPESPRDWMDVPEVQNLFTLDREQLLMFVVDELGNYHSHILGVGTKDQCPVPDFRIMVELYHKMNGQYFVLVHNHPGSTHNPSPNDEEVTENMRKFFGMTDVVFQDHIIVMKNREFYSMRVNGYFGATED